MFYGSKLDENGIEIPNNRRPVVPAGWRAPEPLTELIQRLVRTELSKQAAAEGAETFEESDDFEIDEDADDFISAYEIRDMAPEAGQADAAPPEGGVKPAAPINAAEPPAPPAATPAQ